MMGPKHSKSLTSSISSSCTKETAQVTSGTITSMDNIEDTCGRRVHRSSDLVAWDRGAFIEVLEEVEDRSKALQNTLCSTPPNLDLSTEAQKLGLHPLLRG
jgi:hypothetical protein